MRRPRHKGAWIFWIIAVFAWFAPTIVQAATYVADSTNRDFYFDITEPQTLTIRTYAQQYGIDSMLWLYDSNNTLLAANDDWYGLDSNISLNLFAGTYRLRAGVCCGNPDAWYGTSYVIEASMESYSVTTTTTTTTTEPLTTTIEPTTTTIEPTTTTLESTTTTWVEPTTTTTTTSTTTVPETTVPATTTTSTIVQETTTTEATTTTTSTTTSTTSTTTSVPQTTTTSSTTTTTTTVYVPPVTTTTEAPAPPLPPPTTTTVAPTTTTTVVETTTTEAPTTTVAPTTTASVPNPPRTTVPAPVQPPTSSTLQPAETTTTSTSPTTVPETTVPSTIPKEPSVEQALEFVTNAEVVANLTGEQAQELFSAIDEDNLTEEQVVAILEGLKDAPDEVKEAFEENVDVFSGNFDTYVPSGSTITVAQRRAVVAATAVLFVVPLPVPTSSSAPSGNSRKKG